jgi:3-phosphoshikimate 1-carboxyvinyltransferase
MDSVQVRSISRIQGSVAAPCSKSYAQRAIAIAACSRNPVTLFQFGESDDALAALRVVEQLGATYKRDGDTVQFIQPIELVKDNYTINIGEAGLSARLFSSFSLFTTKSFRIEGHGSIKTRPMDMVIEPLKQLGKKVLSSNNCLPIEISGEIAGNSLRVDGSESSQFITGLLIVLPQLKESISLTVEHPRSKPYIDMTLDILNSFGIRVFHENYERFEFACNQQPLASEYWIEGDWSGASFLAVAGAIGGQITITNLNANSKQADLAILNAIRAAGANVELKDTSVIVEKRVLKGFNFDATECPDLFPPLVALAAKCEGITTVKGLHRLKHKESDRGVTLKTEFNKIGIQVELNTEEDCMLIYGNPNMQISSSIEFDSHGDHRIAMATALMAIGSSTDIIIHHAAAINKSYPDFFDVLNKLS